MNFLLFTRNKSNSPVRFLGESNACQSAFQLYLTFSQTSPFLWKLAFEFWENLAAKSTARFCWEEEVIFYRLTQRRTINATLCPFLPYFTILRPHFLMSPWNTFIRSYLHIPANILLDSVISILRYCSIRNLNCLLNIYYVENLSSDADVNGGEK